MLQEDQIESDDAKRPSELLEDQSELWQTLIDFLPDYIYVKDTQSRFLANNQAHLHKLGVNTQEEVLGKTDFDFFPEDLASKFYADEQKCIQSGVPIIDREVCSYNPHLGEQWVSITKVPWKNARGETGGIIGISRDITEKHKAQREREKLIADLECKNEELEQFNYVVSHDLKSPLITIKGFAGLMGKALQAGKVDRLQSDINRIVSAAEKMQQLLDNLLELSRAGRKSGNFERVSLSEMAHEAADMLDAQITERGARIEIDPQMPPARGDRCRLQQVMQNLIENAVKFMGDQEDPIVSVGFQEKDGRTVYHVRDNGIGIDSSFHDKVFGLFDQFDQEAEGTGIGLALVKRVVEAHGGQIWIESEGVGKGASFSFTLNLSQGDR